MKPPTVMLVGNHRYDFFGRIGLHDLGLRQTIRGAACEKCRGRQPETLICIKASVPQIADSDLFRPGIPT
jgi:hypothetical protein